MIYNNNETIYQQPYFLNKIILKSLHNPEVICIYIHTHTHTQSYNDFKDGIVASYTAALYLHIDIFHIFFTSVSKTTVSLNIYIYIYIFVSK